MPCLLALETATDTLRLGVAFGGRVFEHEGPGSAQSSATLIPALWSLMAQAGCTMRDIDAIAFGRGPGAFTGLRTACSVAQGLALGTRCWWWPKPPGRPMATPRSGPPRMRA